MGVREESGVFRPKRNDERRAATRFSRDGSPAERRVGFITGCLDKRVHGPLVAEEIGMGRIRSECPRFGAWLKRLESLPAALGPETS